MSIVSTADCSSPSFAMPSIETADLGTITHGVKIALKFRDSNRWVRTGTGDLIAAQRVPVANDADGFSSPFPIFENADI